MQEAARREKRRLLDAQRGKCRIRLGTHLAEWCALKDHLGFSLHSQLAKFLLDSYRTTSSPGTAVVPEAIALLSVSIPSLHRLACLCHQHGRDCNSPPTISAHPCSVEASETPALLWGCKENHQFYWDPHDCNVGLDSNNTEEDVPGLSSMQQNRRMEQENVPKITVEEGDVSNTESLVQRTEPESPALPEISQMTCPEQSQDVGRVTQCTSEDRLTTGSEWPLTTNVSEEQPETITDEGLCHIGHEILVSSAEVGDTEDEDTGPQSIEVSEDTQDSISMDLVKKKPDTASSGRACRHLRTQPAQSYQQALETEPKTVLSLPCRRSPRSSKGCRTRADAKQQVQLSNVARGSSDVKGQYIDVLLGSDANTDLSRRSPQQKSSTQDVTKQETRLENFESLVGVIEQKETPPAGPQSESGEMSGVFIEEEQNRQIGPLENEGEEPQSSQCKGQKANRRKSLLDEELAQICKKRIRKATPQELLMCDYEDCGKIFSKRQYLNYHQKYQHMNQRTFRCSVTECGKTFNFKKHLKEHEKRHSDRRDFICEFCARAFRSSSNLIIHRRIHTGEKPLQCEFCGFTCRQKASLNWHMKKHDADSFYNFPCDICGQRFEKRDNLAAHKSRKHPAPREMGPQDSSQCITSSMEDVCQAEASCKDDHTESITKDPDQKMAPAAPEGGKETIFPEYLNLPESVQEVSQQAAQTPGNPGISLVIVL
ncbi:zinc finger protein 692-like isoform 1-T1 [Leptodactylus fuscus]|uniref:zinc finger protein 692-like isoform X1 n=1 Tax=Leptodactylus fuscus TaxID=238119 RepID=UPI003F4EC568